MAFPKELKYAESHEWLRVEGEEAYIGITDFAVTELNDLIYIEIEVEGETLEKGEEFGVIEASKVASKVYMPVSGEVLEVNQDALDNPEMLKDDAYENGWLIKIRMTDPSQANSLLDAAAYEALTKK
ncbi:MAG: glycine cleavage system protein GcvH [Bacteroidales bacterium]|nr:glycine cleavage system protein GcvH [Bacteroidales bacterium]